MQVKFVDVDGVRTRYLCAGDGYPLILIHGVGISGDSFLHNIEELAENFSVYAPDILGHGFTDAVEYAGGPPQPQTTHHLCRMAEILGLERYSIAGSSYGALISALMYFACPERVGSLILIGSGSVFHPAEEQATTLRAAAANAGAAMGNPTLESCRSRLANIVYSPNSVADDILLVQLTSYALPDRFDAYKATIEGMLASVDSVEHRVFTRLEDIDVPCLVITGRQDIRSDVAHTEVGCERLPQAELHIFEHCGHMPYMEHPGEFNRLVREFLLHQIGSDTTQEDTASGIDKQS